MSKQLDMPLAPLFIEDLFGAEKRIKAERKAGKEAERMVRGHFRMAPFQLREAYSKLGGRMAVRETRGKWDLFQKWKKNAHKMTMERKRREEERRIKAERDAGKEAERRVRQHFERQQNTSPVQFRGAPVSTLSKLGGRIAVKETRGKWDLFQKWKTNAKKNQMRVEEALKARDEEIEKRKAELEEKRSQEKRVFMSQEGKSRNRRKEVGNKMGNKIVQKSANKQKSPVFKTALQMVKTLPSEEQRRNKEQRFAVDRASHQFPVTQKSGPHQSTHGPHQFPPDQFVGNTGSSQMQASESQEAYFQMSKQSSDNRDNLGGLNLQQRRSSQRSQQRRRFQAEQYKQFRQQDAEGQLDFEALLKAEVEEPASSSETGESNGENRNTPNMASSGNLMGKGQGKKVLKIE
jgi:hypothetical protein